jgi:hypothetical protein
MSKYCVQLDNMLKLSVICYTNLIIILDFVSIFMLGHGVYLNSCFESDHYFVSL